MGTPAMPENKNPLLTTFSDLKVYFGRWLSWRTFTLSRLLQRGLWLLRRLRPLCCTLAFSRPFRARQCESSSIPSENVVATRSCLLYAERLWSPFSDVHRKMYPPGIGPHLT